MLLHNLVRCYQLVLGQLGVCQLGEWKITILGFCEKILDAAPESSLSLFNKQ